MSDVLARFEQKDLQGISPSMPHQQGRLFRSGENVIFHEDSVQPVLGQNLLYAKLSSEPILGLKEHQKSTGTKYLHIGTETKLYRWDSVGGISQQGTGYTIESIATATRRAQAWSFQTWHDWILATNGENQVQIDKTGGGFGNLAGTNFTYAEILMAMGDFVLAISTSNGKNVIQWCDKDNPESWTPSNTSSAGSMTLRVLESEIIGAAYLGQLVACYGTDGSVAIQHVGGDFNMTQHKMLTGTGLVGKRAVCSVGAFNYGMSYRNLWVSDGAESASIEDPETHDEIFNNINLDQISKTVVWYDKLFDQVVYFYPTMNSLINDRAAVYKRRYKIWSFWDFGRSAAIESGIFPYGITGTETGEAYYQNVQNTLPSIGGEPIDVSYEAVMLTGFGMGGFGQWGFGGRTAISGS